MKEETTISFKDQTGFRFSECDITTGKVVVNDIEITSVEDWEKVTKSISDLQSQLKAKEEVIKEARECVKKIKLHYQQSPTMIPTVKINKLDEILSKGDNK